MDRNKPTFAELNKTYVARELAVVETDLRNHRVALATCHARADKQHAAKEIRRLTARKDEVINLAASFGCAQ